MQQILQELAEQNLLQLSPEWTIPFQLSLTGTYCLNNSLTDTGKRQNINVLIFSTVLNRLKKNTPVYNRKIITGYNYCGKIKTCTELN